MAKTFIYIRESFKGDVHRCAKRCCENCDLMDIFFSRNEAKAFSEGGSKKAFKDVRGEIIGSDADRLRLFCTRDGASVRPNGVCRHHVWSKDAWVKPNEEMTLC